MDDKQLAAAIRKQVLPISNHLKTVLTPVVQQVQQGLFTAERRINTLWNLLNVNIRILEVTGIKQGWWKDTEEFQALFVQARADLERESKEHEAAERARIREEQHAGGVVIPMRPVPGNVKDDSNSDPDVG